MTSLLESIDPRIVAACPSCYISTLRAVCAAIGSQDAEQNVFGQLGFGLNHAGYVLIGGNAVRMPAASKTSSRLRGLVKHSPLSARLPKITALMLLDTA